jgi:hypothetical protein
VRQTSVGHKASRTAFSRRILIVTGVRTTMLCENWLDGQTGMEATCWRKCSDCLRSYLLIPMEN